MKLKYEFQAVELDGNIMAVPITNKDEFNSIIRLNETAAFIFNLLKEETTVDEIVAKAIEEYKTDPDEIKKYVTGFVNTLSEKGILK